MLTQEHSNDAAHDLRYDYAGGEHRFQGIFLASAPNTTPPAASSDSSSRTASAEHYPQLTVSSKLRGLAARLESLASSMTRDVESVFSMLVTMDARFRSCSNILSDIRSTVGELAHICTQSADGDEKPEAQSPRCLEKPVCPAFTLADTKDRTSDVPVGALHHHHAFSQPSTLQPVHQFRAMAKGAHANTKQAPVSAGAATTAPVGGNGAAASAAKRPLSDFNFFCRDARKLVVEAHPEYTKEQVNKELGRIWSLLDRASRQYYRDMYVRDKQRYSLDIAAKARAKMGAHANVESSIGTHSSARPQELPLPSVHSIRHSTPHKACTAHGAASADSSRTDTLSSIRIKHTIWRFITMDRANTGVNSSPGKPSSSIAQPAAAAAPLLAVPSVYSAASLAGRLSNPSLPPLQRPACHKRTSFAAGAQPWQAKRYCPSETGLASNAVKNLLNDPADASRFSAKANEAEDVDEPLANSLLRSTHNAYASGTHGLRETISSASTVARDPRIHRAPLLSVHISSMSRSGSQ
ncbi:high mobility group [Coemansia sp. Benny D115]|nr:high mobility group [Coemansia sp. Benny D115]